MDWLEQAGAPLANTPEWILFAAAATAILLLAISLRLAWPKSRKPDVAAHTTKRPPAAPQTSLHKERGNSQTEQSPASRIVMSYGAFSTDDTSAITKDLAAADPGYDDNRSVRVFVSSTFLDMQAERDELVTK